MEGRKEEGRDGGNDIKKEGGKEGSFQFQKDSKFAHYEE